MRSLPEGLVERVLARCLSEGWGLDVDAMRYEPVGFGSYHWEVRDAGGRRYFVTVDDLDVKGWLGDDRDSALDGLRAAFDTANALRRDGGLAFVVAPLPAAGGETVLRLDPRYSAALFPFVEARGRFAEQRTPAEREDLVRLLADLHAATPAALPFARGRHLDLPHRRRLETALGDLGRPWSGGPFSEPLRALLTRHAPGLRRRLRELDRLAAAVQPGSAAAVVTHGEPHHGNVLRGGGRLLLVDWDTVGLAPPERDLWMVGDDAGALARYSDITGRRIDPDAVALYRLRWELDDISSFTNVLRSTHARSPDTEKAWQGLHTYLGSDDR